MYYRTNNVTEEQVCWIKNFLDPIQYDPKIQGQETEDGFVKIGPWAGPEADISNVLHEICHFVEIDEARMKDSGWGLRYPTQEIFGQTFHEFSKPYHIERERRVWAYQLNLNEKYGIRENAYKLASGAVFLDGFNYLIPEHRGKTDKQAIKIFAKSIEKLAEEPKYSFDSFLKEFDRRKGLLNKKSLIGGKTFI